MEFGQLLRRRLKIASTVAQNDQGNSESVKGVLSVIVQCIHQQANTIQLVQSEVADKVAAQEFKQVIGQKLGLREFLGYFQKVQRVVEKMESHWANHEERTGHLINTKLQGFGNQLQEQVEERVRGLFDDVRRQMGRFDDFREAMGEIERTREAVSQIEVGCQQGILDLKIKMSQHLTQMQQLVAHNSQQNKCQCRCSGQIQMGPILTQLKEMQLDIGHTHKEIGLLMQSVIEDSRKGNINEELSLNNQKMDILQRNADRMMEERALRWLWRWRPESVVLQCQDMSLFEGGQGRMEALGEGCVGLQIRRAGLHRVVFGYLMQSQVSGQLRVSVEGRVLYTMKLQGGAESGLCRASMLYCYLGGGCTLGLQVSGRGGATGFFQVQHL